MEAFVIHVVFADDHPVMIMGIEQALSTVSALKVLGFARNSSELIDILDKSPCDVLVSDYSMPGGEYGDGIALFSFIQRRYPKLKLVVYTMLDGPAVLYSLLKQNILCVVSKSDATSHLVPAIYAAYTSGTYYSPTMNNADEGGGRSVKALSPREAEIVRLFASGLTVDAIAEMLNRSKKTISTQKRKAMEKLGVQNEIDLLRYAIDNGFVTSSHVLPRPE